MIVTTKGGKMDYLIKWGCKASMKQYHSIRTRLSLIARSKSILPEGLIISTGVLMAHANYSGLAARIRPKEPCSHTTNGIAVDLVNLLRHFRYWDLATIHQYLTKKIMSNEPKRQTPGIPVGPNPLLRQLDSPRPSSSLTSTGSWPCSAQPKEWQYKATSSVGVQGEVRSDSMYFHRGQKRREGRRQISQRGKNRCRCGGRTRSGRFVGND